MNHPAVLDLPLPWVQQCLDETGWTQWQPRQALGVGAWSMAVLVQRAARSAVLLLDRPDRPAFTKPGITGTLCLYRSAAAIRLACRRAGMPVARTLGAPRPWSGGAAVLMGRVPGRDLEHMLGDPSLDGEAIGRSVASIVSLSQVLAQAHRAHRGGFGNHLFGCSPPHPTALAQWALCIDPLVGHDSRTDKLVEGLQDLAAEMLSDTPRTTQVWDVGDRNIMLDEKGRVTGLVDQVDMSTGDPLLVPGFSLAMLGDVHAWSKIDAYAAGWRQAWSITPEQWARVQLHRLTCHGRFIGKRLDTLPPPVLRAWQDRAAAMLAV